MRHRWHADIKPDNILLVQDRFKLADPGFAVFKSKTDADSDPVAEIQGGTEAYGKRCHIAQTFESL